MGVSVFSSARHKARSFLPGVPRGPSPSSARRRAQCSQAPTSSFSSVSLARQDLVPALTAISGRVGVRCVAPAVMSDGEQVVGAIGRLVGAMFGVVAQSRRLVWRPCRLVLTLTLAPPAAQRPEPSAPLALPLRLCPSAAATAPARPLHSRPCPAAPACPAAGRAGRPVRRAAALRPALLPGPAAAAGPAAAHAARGPAGRIGCGTRQRAPRPS